MYHSVTFASSAGKYRTFVGESLFVSFQLVQLSSIFLSQLIRKQNPLVISVHDLSLPVILQQLFKYFILSSSLPTSYSVVICWRSVSRTLVSLQSTSRRLCNRLVLSSDFFSIPFAEPSIEKTWKVRESSVLIWNFNVNYRSLKIEILCICVPYAMYLFHVKEFPNTPTLYRRWIPLKYLSLASCINLSFDIFIYVSYLQTSQSSYENEYHVHEISYLWFHIKLVIYLL